jgi:hypothetical protein
VGVLVGRGVGATLVDVGEGNKVAEGVATSTGVADDVTVKTMIVGVKVGEPVCGVCPVTPGVGVASTATEVAVGDTGAGVNKYHQTHNKSSSSKQATTNTPMIIIQFLCT